MATGLLLATKVAPGRVKMMLSRLIKGFPDAAEVRITCLRMEDPDAMLDHLEAECARRGVLDARPLDLGVGLEDLEERVPSERMAPGHQQDVVLRPGLGPAGQPGPAAPTTATPVILGDVVTGVGHCST